jgi:hypothetical protein
LLQRCQNNEVNKNKNKVNFNREYKALNILLIIPEEVLPPERNISWMDSSSIAGFYKS